MTGIENKASVEREGIILIPDISGFSKFVHDTDIKLGWEIVAELLSVMLNTNILNLKVSEIEGDAILFYKYGPPPTLNEIINQYELMLISFKKKLRELYVERQLSVLDLSLKLIVHTGPIAEFKLYGFTKLYGEAIIEAHQLLKTDTPSHNYILVTKDYFDKLDSHETEEMILPKWVRKEVVVPAGNISENLSFTYFLYDIELLKANVLQQRGNEHLNTLDT